MGDGDFDGIDLACGIHSMRYPLVCGPWTRHGDHWQHLRAARGSSLSETVRETELIRNFELQRLQLFRIGQFVIN